MTRATLLALADRVEALTGPCRETDELIAAALVGAVRQVQPFHNSVAYHNAEGTMWVSVTVPSPGYTASLDAAMTLVPDGGRWFKCGVNDPITNAAQTRMFVCGPQDDEGRFQVSGECLTDETAHGDCLALTAAALRARAMMEIE